MNLDEKRAEVIERLQAQSNSETSPEAMRYGMVFIEGLKVVP